jgi:hypothetical protein
MQIQKFLSDNEARILGLLAKHPGLTMYKIRQQLHLRSSSVLFLTRQLTERNLARAIREQTWRTGGRRRELVLTFVGIVLYLDKLEKSKTRNPEILRALLEHYGRILDYPPFSEVEKIDVGVTTKGAEGLCSIASLLTRGLGEPPSCPWNLVTFEHPQTKRLRALWRIDENQIRRLKAEQEKLWMDEFAMLLLAWHFPEYGPIHSSRLNSFYKQLLEERISRMRQDLGKMTQLLRDIDTRIRR